MLQGVYGAGNEDINGAYKRDGIHEGSNKSNILDNPLLYCLNLFKLLPLLYLVFIFSPLSLNFSFTSLILLLLFLYLSN
jgi:hypothetical protein